MRNIRFILAAVVAIISLGYAAVCMAEQTPEPAITLPPELARNRGEADIGKFTLTLRKGPGDRWLIMSDMDNGNQ